MDTRTDRDADDLHSRQRAVDDAKQRADWALGACHFADDAAERAITARNDAKRAWLDARDTHKIALRALLND